MNKNAIFITGLVVLSLLLAACTNNNGDQSGNNGSSPQPTQKPLFSLPNFSGNNQLSLTPLPTSAAQPGSVALPTVTSVPQQPGLIPVPNTGSGSQSSNDNNQGNQEQNQGGNPGNHGKGKGNGNGNKNKGNDNQGGDTQGANQAAAPTSQTPAIAYLPLSALKNALIVNPGGQPIGTVTGVVMDEASGNIPYLIFNRQGNNGKTAAVPLSAFNSADAVRPQKKALLLQTVNQMVLVYHGDEKMINAAPTFNSGNDLNGNLGQVQSYWANQPGAAPASANVGSQRSLSFDDLQNLPVFNSSAQPVGTIRDIVVDRSANTRAFVYEPKDNPSGGYLLLAPGQFTRQGLSENQPGFVLTAGPDVLQQAQRVKNLQDLYPAQ